MLLLLAVGLVLAFAGCHTGNANSNEVEAVAVRTAKVEKTNITADSRYRHSLRQPRASFRSNRRIVMHRRQRGQSVRRDSCSRH
jgi:hypothetical protein